MMLILPYHLLDKGSRAASLLSEVMHILFFNRVNVPFSSKDMPVNSQGGQVSVSHFFFLLFSKRLL